MHCETSCQALMELLARIPAATIEALHSLAPQTKKSKAFGKLAAPLLPISIQSLHKTWTIAIEFSHTIDETVETMVGKKLVWLALSHLKLHNLSFSKSPHFSLAQESTVSWKMLAKRYLNNDANCGMSYFVWEISRSNGMWNEPLEVKRLFLPHKIVLLSTEFGAEGQMCQLFTTGAKCTIVAVSEEGWIFCNLS